MHIHTHTLGVFMLVYETKLCLCAQKVTPTPPFFASFGKDPLSALLCVYLPLSLLHTHTHSHPVFCYPRGGGLSLVTLFVQ